MNNRWIIVFDWETDSPDPKTCNPVELAAVPVNPRTLEIKKEQAFKAVIKPDGIDSEDYFTKERQSTINWHAKTRGVEPEDIIKEWKTGQSEKVVWKNFCNYCSKYEVDKKPGQWYVEPIPSGYDIIGFDLPNSQKRDILVEKLYKNGLICNKTGVKSIRLRPNLNLNENEVDHALQIFKGTMKQC